MRAEVRCPHCSYVLALDESPARIDQSANGKLWEHLQAAHYHEVKVWRAMGMDDRREMLKPYIHYS
jgi:predicted metal-dependent phosphoesterase TrpH